MRSMGAFAHRTSTKPSAEVNGRRRAAISGGMIAFRMPITAVASRAIQKVVM